MYKTKIYSSLGTIGSENYKKLELHIDRWLDEYGLSERRLKTKMLSLMEAKETKLFPNRNENNELEIVEHKIPALEVQRRSLDKACKIKGLYSDQAINNTSIENVLVQIHNDRGSV